MHKIYQFLLLSFFLASCSENKLSIKKAQLRINSPKSCITVKEFKDKKKTFYYTYDFRTREKIILYSVNGTKLKEINLSKFTSDNSCEFSDLIIDNSNRYIFLTSDNRVYVTDEKLKILKLHTYFNLLHSGLKLVPSTYISNNTYTTAILASWPDGQTFATDSLSGQFLHNQPIIAEINLSNGKIKTLGQGIVSRYLSPIKLDLSGIHYNLSGQNNYTYISPFTDTIYSISKAGKITAELRIISKIGTINCPSFEKKQLMHDSKFMLNTYISNSFPNRNYYDKYRKLNYLIIRKPKKDYADFPFNILIYNENWGKLDELEFKGDTYRLNFLVTKEGLLMERANNNSEKRIFDCLEYHNLKNNQ